MYRIFICHSTKDDLLAKRVVESLEKMNLKCWIAPRDLPPGSNHLREIPAAIEECDCFLILLSENAYISRWVELELLRAIDGRKSIIPLAVDDTPVHGVLAFALQNTQIRSIEMNFEEVLQKVAALLHANPDGLPRGICDLTSEQCHERACSSTDPYDAAKWYRAAANRGHAQAQKKLGDCYLYGDGVPVNEELAIHWYQEAAWHGLADALYELGACYDFGCGVVRQGERAAAYYLCAAEQGHVSAQFCLGSLYEEGDGVRKDRAEARRWYKQAASHGDRMAREKLLQLAG